MPVAGSPHGAITATTDVPALVGASIDNLRHRLGPYQPLPKGFADPVMASADSMTVPDSVAAFRTGGIVVVANYNARTRQVRDLLLLGHHEDSLMAKATLRANAAEYLVLPVFYANSANRLLGLRIVAIN